jgi:hypothetical protein
MATADTSAAIKATQKRWKRDGHRTIVTDDAGNLLICEVFSGGIGNEDADAVECLIATAPELLTLLQDWVDSFAGCIEGGEADEMVSATRAVIAKATRSAA